MKSAQGSNLDHPETTWSRMEWVYLETVRADASSCQSDVTIEINIFLISVKIKENIKIKDKSILCCEILFDVLYKACADVLCVPIYVSILVQVLNFWHFILRVINRVF